MERPGDFLLFTAYAAAIVSVSFGWAQYSIRIRRLSWLPLTAGAVSYAILMTWLYALGMPVDSLLPAIARMLIIVSLAAFVFQAAAGWLAWHRRPPA